MYFAGNWLIQGAEVHVCFEMNRKQHTVLCMCLQNKKPTQM